MREPYPGPCDLPVTGPQGELRTVERQKAGGIGGSTPTAVTSSSQPEGSIRVGSGGGKSSKSEEEWHEDLDEVDA